MAFIRIEADVTLEELSSALNGKLKQVVSQDECCYEVRGKQHMSHIEDVIDYNLTIQEAAAHLDDEPDGYEYYIVKMKLESK